MKFCLLENIRSSFHHRPFNINNHVDLNNERRPARVRVATGLFPMDITPFDQSSSEISRCALLKALLEKEISAADGGANPSRVDEFWSLVIRLEVKNKYNGMLILHRDGARNALSKLADLFEGITVQVDLKVLENEQDDASVLATIQSKDMTLLEEGEESLFEECVLFPARFFLGDMIARDPPVSARVTMTVTIPDDIFNARFATTSPKPWAQKMLEDGALTDVTIVCGEETEIKAHRIVLATRSSVFMAMFQTDMKESRESTVEIPDMEEKPVLAFLKYLYYDDTKDPEEEFKVALELFKAGHKYDVQCLERKMKELLFNKPNDKIDMEGALRLFLFARNLIPAEKELMKKATKVLERYSDNLQDFPEMQQLFRTYPQAALELLQYAYKRN